MCRVYLFNRLITGIPVSSRKYRPLMSKKLSGLKDATAVYEQFQNSSPRTHHRGFGAGNKTSVATSAHAAESTQALPIGVTNKIHYL